MTDERPSQEPERDGNAQLRSPVRPAYTPVTAPPPVLPQTRPAASPSPQLAEDAPGALAGLRAKMNTLVEEYAAGKINRTQFHVLYSRYSEQRSIIEKLTERNPQTDAWKQVVKTRGQTGFLRAQFQAQPVMFAVAARGRLTPILASGGSGLENTLLERILTGLWRLPPPADGALGRKELADGTWMILAAREFAATIVIFTLEPSSAQARLVRDLHADFERANRILLQRGPVQSERLVFPQRALIEKTS